MTVAHAGLARFLEAQAPIHEVVLEELAAGEKRTHWMWFIFPQLRALGRSNTALFYGIESAAEARAYWQHAILGTRLKICVDTVLRVPPDRTAHDIFGTPDDLKFRSCLTLFAHVAPQEGCFGAALARFYGGQADARTLALLGA